MSQFSQRIAALSPKQREILELRLRKEGIDISRYRQAFAPVQNVEKKEYYSLSSAQKRLYILQQLERQSTGYNVYSVIVLEEEVDKDEMEEVFNKIIARHEILRTSFEIVNGKPAQRIHDMVDFNLEYNHCKCESDKNESGVEEIIRNFVKPFELSKAPLLRARLTRAGRAKYILLFDMHHIVIDHISQTVLKREFMAIYAGAKLAAIRLHYKDYVEWQNSAGRQELIKQQESYWLKMFSGEIPMLNFPTDYSRSAKQDYEGDEYYFELNEELTSKLKRMIVEKDVTLFMVLIGAYNVLLSRLSGQDDIIVGVPVEGRSHDDLRDIIGMFVNILVFRSFPRKKKTFLEFLGEVKQNALKAFSNQDYQFEVLLDKLKFRRDLSRNPVFDTVFNLQDVKRIASVSKLNFNKLKYSFIEFNRMNSRYDINIYAYDMGHLIYFICTYKTSLFKRSTIEYIMAGYLRLIEQILRNHNKLLKDYKIFG